VGEFTIEWTIIDGDTDAATPLARHAILIRSAPNFDPGSNPPRPWYPSLYVDRHGELLSTVLWHHPNRALEGRQGFTRYLSNVRANQAGASLDVMFNASPEWGANNNTRGANLRCTKNGERVDLRTAYDRGNTRGTRTDEVQLSDAESSYAQSTVPNPAGDNPRVIQEHYLFRRYYAALPLTFGPENDQRPDATPVTEGQWECEIRNDQGVSLRTFRFTVGADARVASHAEQGAGLSLAPDAVLIETVIPEDNAIDFRTDPSALSRAFSGRGFRTDATRAWQRGVRQIGVAAPASGRGGRRR
jgi:hypothetical protein